MYTSEAKDSGDYSKGKMSLSLHGVVQKSISILKTTKVNKLKYLEFTLDVCKHEWYIAMYNILCIATAKIAPIATLLLEDLK